MLLSDIPRRLSDAGSLGSIDSLGPADWKCQCNKTLETMTNKNYFQALDPALCTFSRVLRKPASLCFWLAS